MCIVRLLWTIFRQFNSTGVVGLWVFFEILAWVFFPDFAWFRVFSWVLPLSFHPKNGTFIQFSQHQHISTGVGFWGLVGFFWVLSGFSLIFEFFFGLEVFFQNVQNKPGIVQAFFFTDFCPTPTNGFAGFLSFGEKIFEFRDNFLSLGEKNWCFIRKICYFCLKITKNCRIRKKICLTLAKNCWV